MVQFSPVWMMHLLSLATLLAGATPLQAADILGKQDVSALRDELSIDSQGGPEVDTIDTAEAEDASVEIETLPFPQRKPLFTDLIAHDLSDYRLSRDVLKSRWSEAWHSDLPCSKPSHSGLVPKMGTGSQLPTMRIGQEMELYINEEFPVYSNCAVYISERWRFIYIRQPKSSSRALLKAFNRLCSGPGGEGKCNSEELRLVDHPEDIDDQTWKDFFVFTVVRNPWTRMLSAYKMFTRSFLRKRSAVDGNTPGDPCGLPFQEFAQNTNNMMQLCRRDQCCAYIAGDLNKWRPKFLNSHITDQSHCVFLPGGESVVDFIGTTESLDADWSAVIDEINRRSGAHLEAGNIGNPNGRGAPGTGGMENACGMDTVRSLFNESTLYSIGTQYARDIIKFGYL